MAKKQRTPQELERIRQRKEFVQANPELDPAEARKRFYVQTRVKELEKSGVEVTKERRAALRQKFLTGGVQRQGFYTPADLAKYTGSSGSTGGSTGGNTGGGSTPTVKQTGGYVTPSMRKGVADFKPNQVQKSSKSRQVGFKQLGKDIVSGVQSARKFMDDFSQELTGAAQIQRAIDDKNSPIANRIGEGLLGLGTGIINTTGVGFLANKVRGAKNTVTVINTTRALPKGQQVLGLPSGKKALDVFELPSAPRVIDRVFDMPPVQTPKVRKPSTRSSTKTPKVKKPSTTKTSTKNKVEFSQSDAQAAPFADVPKPGTKVNLGKPGESGNPPFRQSAQPSTGKTIEWVRPSTGQAPVPQSLAEVKAVVTPKTPTTPVASTGSRMPGQTFRNKFGSQAEFDTWMATGGKGTLQRQTSVIQQDFIKKNAEFIKNASQRSARRATADKIAEAQRRAEIEAHNRSLPAELQPRAKIPKSQDPLRQPVKRKPATKKAPTKKLTKNKKTKAK